MSSSGPMKESKVCPAFDVPIESRTCSAYDISIAKKSDPMASVTINDENASSVIDRSEIASRGIQGGITRDQINEEIRSFIHAPLTLLREHRSFLTIVMFLTRLPVPMTIDLHPGFLMKGMCYFPAVGMLIGMAVAATYDLFTETVHLPAVIAAAASIGTGWIITGCLHEDGLSDSVDGES